MARPLFLVLLAGCTMKPSVPTDTDTDSDTDSDSDTDPLMCEHPGCDELCIPVGTEWGCTDTAAPFEVCYLEDFQVCEPQSDGTCGWTMLDQAGWDSCVAASNPAL